ncbi:MAG: hypothetical protein P1P87_01410 [Trueperaceae bacterium]|nr:hypothetical protein [Trueperaceae bacterium]
MQAAVHPQPTFAPPAHHDLMAPTTAPKAPVAAPPIDVAHLTDPRGLRVVAYRPASRWPLRRLATRIPDPFRGFPRRSTHLIELMYGRARQG